MVKENSMKKMIIKVLGEKGENGRIVPLSEIYEGCNVVTSMKKSEVRSILNRDCLEPSSLFERGEKRTGYRLRVKSV